MKIRSVNFSFKFIWGVFIYYYARPFSFLLSIHANLKRNSYLVMRSLKPDLILITTGVQYSDYSEPLSKKQTK